MNPIDAENTASRSEKALVVTSLGSNALAKAMNEGRRAGT